jgi:ribosomal protein L37AE/L43A
LNVPEEHIGKRVRCPYCKAGSVAVRPLGVETADDIIEHSAQIVLTESVPDAPPARNPFACPSCGSEQTQRAAMAYAAGTTVGKTIGGAIAFAGDDIVPVLGASNTESQTDLAASLSPPRPKKIHAVWILVTGLVAATLCAGFTIDQRSPAWQFWVVFVAIMVCFVLLAVRQANKATEHNRTAHRSALGRWNALWICHRCGHRFVLAA